MNENDDGILAVLRELCLQLNITGYKPTSVVWKTTVERSRNQHGYVDYGVLPYDACALGYTMVFLPEKMRGKLEPDEWKPIFASTLLYGTKLRTRFVKGTTLRALRPLVFIALALAILLSVLLPRQGALVFLLVVILEVAVLGVGASVTAGYYGWNKWLLADRDAADIVGPLFS